MFKTLDYMYAHFHLQNVVTNQIMNKSSVDPRETLLQILLLTDYTILIIIFFDLSGVQAELKFKYVSCIVGCVMKRKNHF